MIKLYVYPHAQQQLHESIPGFENALPFSAIGRAKHCMQVTDPAEADYFYMGQVADKDAWLLHPNRFPHFKGNEARHIIDLEGDWRDQDHSAWLQEAIITTGHVRLASVGQFKRRFARPVISPMLMRLVKDPPPYVAPTQRGFWFQGQPDFTHKVREKVAAALEQAQVPGEWIWVPGWSLYRGQEDQLVQEYLANARKWSYALCPVGEGPSARLYEVPLLGRIPILIGDYVPFGAEAVVRLGTNDFVPYTFKSLYEELVEEELFYHQRACQFADLLRKYFEDPTAYLLEWLRGR